MNGNWTLPKIIGQQLLKDDRKSVLHSLSNLTAINSQDTLYPDFDEDYLHHIGQFRIQLLIDWKMFREALAWVCLECELYPDNLEYLVLKESLKNKIYNLPKTEQELEIQDHEWKGIAGMFQLKALIERDVILPLKSRSLYKKFGIPIPNGFLLYGPPGCGKTFFARKIAERIGYTFFEIKPSDVGSTFVHGSQLMLKEIFDNARNKRPAVIFIDEVDALAPSRANGNVSFHYKAEVNELLVQLDSKQNEGLIIVGATNLISELDDAILRPGRFDKKIFVGPPDLKARVETFRMFLESYPHEKLKYDIIAELAEFFTYSEIEYISNEIKRTALSEKVKLETDYICKFVMNYRPMLNEETIKNYF